MRLAPFAAFALAIACAALSPAAAKIYAYPTFDLIEQSNLIVAGTVQDVDDNAARVAIRGVLAGKPGAPVIAVTPPTAPSCMGRFRHFTSGEEVLLLLKDDGNGLFTVCGDGSGKVVLRPETRAAQIDAYRKLIPIARLADEDAKNRAMLAEATSLNPFLRNEPHHYMSLRLARGKLVKNYAPTLLALLRNPQADVRLAGLRALEFTQIAEAAPLIIKATKDTDPEIAQAASQALARYDTAQTVAAMIALTRSGDQAVRIRAIIDLGNHSERTETKDALVVLLDDKDPKIRGFAANALIGAMRRKAANDAIPKLASLLHDPDDDVRMCAALALGESRNPIVLEPLLNAVRNGDKSTRSYAQSVNSVYMAMRSNDPSAMKLVENNMQLIIDALEHGTWIAPLSALGILAQLKTPESIADIRKAAESHPNSETRGLAKYKLDHLGNY